MLKASKSIKSLCLCKVIPSYTMCCCCWCCCCPPFLNKLNINVIVVIARRPYWEEKKTRVLLIQFRGLLIRTQLKSYSRYNVCFQWTNEHHIQITTMTHINAHRPTENKRKINKHVQYRSILFYCYSFFIWPIFNFFLKWTSSTGQVECQVAFGSRKVWMSPD